MDSNLNLELLLDKEFTETEARQINPLVLALIGDAEYEIFVRKYLVSKNSNMKVNDIHKLVIKFVNAKSQSKFMKCIEDKLNEDELSIYKRGRNCKSSVPKSANVCEYRAATGFETLIGYLYLTGKKERLKELYLMILEQAENISN